MTPDLNGNTPEDWADSYEKPEIITDSEILPIKVTLMIAKTRTQETLRKHAKPYKKKAFMTSRPCNLNSGIL